MLCLIVAMISELSKMTNEGHVEKIKPQTLTFLMIFVCPCVSMIDSQDSG